MKKTVTIIFFTIICLFFQTIPVLSEMSSSNYKINVDSLNFSGDEISSASYQLKATLGETTSGIAESANYKVKAGYRYMVEAVAAAEEEEEEEAVVIPGGGPIPQETNPPIISEIIYTAPDDQTIIIEWQTDEPCTTELDFGLTPEYELGKLEFRPDDLTKKHKIIITDLKPDTKYYFRPRAKDLQGNQTIDKGFFFSTPDTVAPANVGSLKAIPSDKQITLQWQNPLDEDFSGVKIQRSEDYFPLDKNEGETVYDNKGTTFIDRYLENERTYYYTVFSYDDDNNFSSGAITSAVPQSVPTVPPVTPPIIPPDIIPPDEIPVLPPELISPIPKEKVDILDLSEVISFKVAKGTIELKPDKENKVKILPNIALKISIAKEKLSPFLKSIITTIGESSYLLKINKERDTYEAAFITPGSIGEYALNAMILVYKEGKIQIAKGNLEVEEPGYVYKSDVILSETKNPDAYKNAKRITGAEVTLYHFNPETEEWQKWQATQYFQVNPEITDSKGEYAFIVEPGIYYLTVSKNGYQFKKTAEFEAKNLINQKIALQPKSFWQQIKPVILKIRDFSLFWKILIGVIILIIIFLLLKLIPKQN